MEVKKIVTCSVCDDVAWLLSHFHGRCAPFAAECAQSVDSRVIIAAECIQYARELLQDATKCRMMFTKSTHDHSWTPISRFKVSPTIAETSRGVYYITATRVESCKEAYSKHKHTKDFNFGERVRFPRGPWSGVYPQPKLPVFWHGRTSSNSVYMRMCYGVKGSSIY